MLFEGCAFVSRGSSSNGRFDHLQILNKFTSFHYFLYSY